MALLYSHFQKDPVPRDRGVLGVVALFVVYVLVYIQKVVHLPRAPAGPVVVDNLDMITPQELLARGHAGGGIPKLLHQSYKSRSKLKADQLRWMKTWETKTGHATSGWAHVFWSDADNDALVKKELPWFYDTYKRYPHAIQRADIARIAVILTYGGVYADADYECISDGCLDAIYASKCNVLLQGSPYPDVDGLFQNSFMACDKSPDARAFWESTLRLADKHSETNTTKAWFGLLGSGAVLFSTGPGLLTYSYGELLGIDAAEAKGMMHNFDGAKVRALFPSVPTETGSGLVCQLPHEAYSGQTTGVSPASKTFHHNSKSWVDAVHSHSFYLPRLVCTVPWVLVPLYFDPPLFFAFVSLVYLSIQGFPGSVIETVLGTATLAVGLCLFRRNALPGAALAGKRPAACLAGFLLVVCAFHMKFFVK
eukprot:TRINITY_DN7873_c0_g1_i1.p1 TRINITY_DN7873_c0_g1~~TRINITY_DN7873_c0_g1_i1.p1  ORF type:complete len:444 (+),score=163.75 TRINITY_DN7873_c0_g1_i1:61-1332(+)